MGVDSSSVVDGAWEAGAVGADDDAIWSYEAGECTDYGAGWSIGSDYDDGGVWSGKVAHESSEGSCWEESVPGVASAYESPGMGAGVAEYGDSAVAASETVREVVVYGS